MAFQIDGCEVCGEISCGCSAYYDEQDRKAREFLMANGHDPASPFVARFEYENGCPECGGPCRGHTQVQDYLRIAGIPNA